jgi:hypothetical protein
MRNSSRMGFPVMVGLLSSAPHRATARWIRYLDSLRFGSPDRSRRTRGGPFELRAWA